MNTAFFRHARQVPLFVLLLSAYPVAHLAARNAGQFSLGTALAVALASVVSGWIAYLLLCPIARSRYSAGVGAVVLVLMFFGFGLISAWIDSAMVPLQQDSPGAPDRLSGALLMTRLLAASWAIVSIVIACIVARVAWAAKPEVARALTMAGGVLVALSLVPIARASISEPDTLSQASSASGQALQSPGPANRPDVYYIVLDGYARADVLNQYYRFDNSSFVNQLESRGFRVSAASSANYNWTFLSLASTLNLDYLQAALPGRLDPQATDRTLVYESIRDSATGRFLRERGYRIVHFQSTWGATATNPHADREVRCEHQLYTNEFVRAVVEGSWLGAFGGKASVDLAQCHLANFRALGLEADKPGPKFVFAHFLLPHHPYLFDRDGRILRNATVSNQFEFQKRLWEDRAAYVSQLEYVNRMVLDSLDRIIERSGTPPIIVLASDHGPNLSAGLSRADQAAVRLASFGAYLLPGAPPGLVPENGSAVNQFRRVLSHYFAANLPPLPDRYFMSPFDRPFYFMEVPNGVLWSAWSKSTGLEPAPKVASLESIEPFVSRE